MLDRFVTNSRFTNDKVDATKLLLRATMDWISNEMLILEELEQLLISIDTRTTQYNDEDVLKTAAKMNIALSLDFFFHRHLFLSVLSMKTMSNLRRIHVMFTLLYVSKLVDCGGLISDECWVSSIHFSKSHTFESFQLLKHSI